MAFGNVSGRHFLMFNPRKLAWLLGLKAGIFIDHEEGVGWSQVKDGKTLLRSRRDSLCFNDYGFGCRRREHVNAVA